MTASTSTSGSIQEFGPIVIATGYEDALALWDALLAFYLQRRPMRPAAFGFYPETTVHDLHQVVGLLTAEADKLPKDALGRAAAVARWNAYRTEVLARTAGLFMFDVFPENRRFWMSESRALALDLATVAPLPTKSDVVLDAVRSIAEVAEGALDIVGAGASGAVELVTDVAGGAKDAAVTVGGGAKDLLKGAVEGVTDAVVSPLVDVFGKPLLVGAAVVGGLLVVPRVLDRGTRRAA